MRKHIAAISSLALLASIANPAFAQVGGRQAGGPPTGVGQPASAAGGSAIDFRIVDEKGQPVRVESLPKETQADVERVRRAAESLTVPGPGGAATRVKVTVSCSWPPLRCTITVQF